MSDLDSDIGGVTKRTHKVILLGDELVGKTSIINRFASNKFNKNQNSTVGVDFFGKNIVHEGKTHRLQLWDTSGNERYRSLIPNYLKDAACGLFVYDLSAPATIQSLEGWIRLFKDHRGDKAVVAICGNKSDLEQPSQNQQKIKTEEPSESSVPSKYTSASSQATLKFLMNKYNAKHFRISAAAGKQIHEMFHDIIDEIIEEQKMTASKNLVKSADMLNPTSSHSFAHEEMKDKLRMQKSSDGYSETLRSMDDEPGQTKRKRRRKAHKLNTVETERLQQKYQDQQIGESRSCWQKICPCFFK